MEGSKRQVRVHLRSVQVDPSGHTLDMTHEYDGLFYDRPRERYVIFEEAEPRVTTSYKIRPNEVHLTRRGAISSQQTFRAGDEDFFEYAVGEGILQFQTHTHRVDMTFHEGGGEIRLEYQLYSGDDWLGNYSVFLTFRTDDDAV